MFIIFQVNSHNHHIPSHGREHTITINDTPSPAVSVITISDSEDEGTPGKKSNRVAHSNVQPAVSNRKNVISCVSVQDSDNEDHRSSSKVTIAVNKSICLTLYIFSTTNITTSNK